MSKILVVATHATDDPTQSGLAFNVAVGALAAGIEVNIALLGEAAYLAKSAVANSVRGVGFAPLSELIDKVLKAKVPIYV